MISLSTIVMNRIGGLALESTPGMQAAFALKVDKASISSSISSTSDVNVASSSAVKSAYDRASSALSTANSAITNANTAMSNWSNLPNAKSDATNLASSATLATSMAVKSAYDRGDSAYVLATSASSTANNAYNRWSNLPNAKSDSVTLNDANYLATSKAVFTLKGMVDTAQATANQGVTDAAAASANATALFNNKSDSVTSSSSTTMATSKAVKTAYDRQVDILHYAGVNKVAATSAGASVTGTLSVAGAISATGNISAFSDARLKSNVSNLTRCELAMLDGGIRGKRYTMYGEENIGFIAQDVQKYFPELVSEVTLEDGTTYLSLNYMGLIAVLWEITRNHVFYKEAHTY